MPATANGLYEVNRLNNGHIKVKCIAFTGVLIIKVSTAVTAEHVVSNLGAANDYDSDATEYAIVQTNSEEGEPLRRILRARLPSRCHRDAQLDLEDSDQDSKDSGNSTNDNSGEEELDAATDGGGISQGGGDNMPNIANLVVFDDNDFEDDVYLSQQVNGY